MSFIKRRSSTVPARLALSGLAAMIALPALAHGQTLSTPVTPDGPSRAVLLAHASEHPLVGVALVLLVAGLGMISVGIFSSLRMRPTMQAGLLLGAALCA
jgi:hypothetical protein